jgi:hypothetical protein
VASAATRARAHVVLRPIASQFKLRHGALTRSVPGLDVLRPIQRWAEGDPWLDDELLKSMKRELLRASSIPAWEPE